MRLCVPPLSETPSLPADKATNLQPSCETVDGVSTNLYAYDVFGNLTNEVQNGATIARDYDTFGRPTGYALGGFAPSREVHYAYDALGRFASVSAGGSGDVPRPLQTFAYSYLPGTDLVSGYTCGSFSRSVSYDPNRNLISAVTNAFNASTISTFEYANNAAGRRISRLDTFDGVVTTNLFGYNHRSEVISARMGTNTYGYAYDPIGNRLTSSHNAETNSYTANNLNQYTSIDNAEPTYDADGNMTSDGQGWHYAWNGENRMVCASNDDVCVTYAYDHRGRMVRKDIQRRAAESQSISYTWDGWNIVREALSTNPYSLTTNHNVWGLDIDGTLQGAGGVGGLLAVIRDDGTYLPAYDANGNISEHVDASNGEVIAHYDYSPFGEPLVSSGPLATTFTHRFSTKPWCENTSFCEYQMRKYRPDIGRWMSKDLLDEIIEATSFGFINNNPMSFWDYIGREGMTSDNKNDLISALPVCVIKCSIGKLLSGIYEKTAKEIRLCDTIRDHCQENAIDHELRPDIPLLPSPEDIISDILPGPNDDILKNSLICLGNCLGNNIVGLDTHMSFSSFIEGEDPISCNNKKNRVEYSFKMTISINLQLLAMEIGDIASKEIPHKGHCPWYVLGIYESCCCDSNSN